jgi:hypothetical protein
MNELPSSHWTVLTYPPATISDETLRATRGLTLRTRLGARYALDVFVPSAQRRVPVVVLKDRGVVMVGGTRRHVAAALLELSSMGICRGATPLQMAASPVATYRRWAAGEPMPLGWALTGTLALGKLGLPNACARLDAALVPQLTLPLLQGGLVPFSVRIAWRAQLKATVDAELRLSQMSLDDAVDDNVLPLLDAFTGELLSTFGASRAESLFASRRA